MGESSRNLALSGFLLNQSGTYPLDCQLRDIPSTFAWGRKQSCDDRQLGIELRCIPGLPPRDDHSPGTGAYLRLRSALLRGGMGLRLQTTSRN